MKRTVTVLQDDIDNGTKADASQCAIARAVKRDLADLLEPGHFVGVSSVGLNLWSAPAVYTHTANLPAEARQFVEAFDLGQVVEPFKFEVSLRRLEEVEDGQWQPAPSENVSFS